MEEAVNSISWAHQLAVVEDPADHPFVKQILAGAKRIIAYKTTKKEAITPEILHRMYAKLVTPSAELPIICTMTICLLGYAGFFRFSALAFLRESVFYDEHAEISSSQARLPSIEMVLGCPLHVPTLTFAR